jgi:hypothetical protein
MLSNRLDRHGASIASPWGSLMDHLQAVSRVYGREAWARRVWCRDVIELVEDLTAGMAEVARVVSAVEASCANPAPRHPLCRLDLPAAVRIDE